MERRQPAGAEGRLDARLHIQHVDGGEIEASQPVGIVRGHELSQKVDLLVEHVEEAEEVSGAVRCGERTDRRAHFKGLLRSANVI